MGLKKEIDQQVRALIYAGKSDREIMEETDCSKSLVSSRRNQIFADARAIGCEGRLKWLLKNWGFTGEIRRRINAEPSKRTAEGYRIVHKGERGHLRTPYRPDGRFQ